VPPIDAGMTNAAVTAESAGTDGSHQFGGHWSARAGATDRAEVENVYAVTTYRINGGSLSYVLASGGKGSIDLTEVDWRATSRLNAEPVSSTDENSSRRTY